ncbi:MAG: DUF4982 domain-containing protein [Bacteroidaceae bacterium]|nr:DUF4982 domain-containing protein [Bacteroidaceae bacterium]
MRTKQTLLTLVTILTVNICPLYAQYNEQKEQSVKTNAPLSEFVDAQEQLFNFGWKFKFGKVDNAQSKDYDDSNWRTLDLPHDFQFEMPWVEGDPNDKNYKGRGFKEMGEAWYRKDFTIPASYKGKRITLDFGGIMYYGDVYVNGTKVASTEYGYIGFEADITKAVNYGGKNVVAVYANTGKKNGSRWYTGGGIFRDVKLCVSNQTRVARHGLYVTSAPKGKIVRPDNLNAQRIHINPLNPQGGNPNGAWDVMVQMQVVNWQKHNLTLKATLKDADGKVVGTSECGMPDHTKQNDTEVALPFISVEKPNLWSVDSPYLYRVEALILEDGVIIDSVSENIGLRTIEYSPEFGFKLNGKKVVLAGIANHHDLGALGIAAYDKAIERQFLQLKAFGFNAIRCSHNPYSENFYKIADKVGLLVVDELIDKWSDNEYWGGRQPFMHIWPELIQEWVKRDRNSPSIVLWSLGNELQTVDGWSGYKTNDWGITTYRIFDQMLKRYDQTRPTTVAMFPARAGAQRGTPDFKTYQVPPELGCATEVNSFNYQWDAYPGYYQYKPDLILFQSEAVTKQLQQPYYGMDRKRGVGLAWWGAIEYWGESDGWPKKGWNYSFFSHTLEAHPQAYLIKSCIKPEEPVVMIGVVDGKGESKMWNDIKVGSERINQNWNQKEGSKPTVFTYTNAEEVELIYNGKSLGTQKNDTTEIGKRNIIKWTVDYGKGGKLIAVAKNGGKEVARNTIETSGKAVGLKIIAEGKNPVSLFDKKNDKWKADGMDLQYLKIYAVDSKGRIVRNATDEVTVKVSGAAQLVAIDNGDHYTSDLFYNVNTKKMQTGFMQAVLRGSRTSGKVVIEVTSPTLRKATFKMDLK